MKYYSFFFVIIISFSLFSCARVGRPTGGEKDVLPPITISASPDFESTNFTGGKIKINFNEYIKFKDLNQQLVISPPLKYSPEIAPLGFPSKQIVIKIKDTLKENTTYTFNFGNAILDNSEGNPLKRFKYLFSTGDYLDSLQMSGTIKDAFLQNPEPNISVLLYVADSTYYDSIVYKSKPNYVTNTLDSIGFSITNIKNGNYYLFALKDRNKNLLFDPKDDKIAFIEEPITITNDSIYTLSLFKEQPEFAVKNVSELSKNHIIIGYEGILDASIENLVDTKSNTVAFLSYKDIKTDSLHIWHKNIDSDSLFINMKHRDSVVVFTQRLRSKKMDSIQLSLNKSGTLHWRDSLYMLSNVPISSIDDNQIKLIDKDSIEIPFKILKDRVATRLLIDFEKEENKDYVFSVLPSAITDYFGQKNDSLSFKFRTKKLEDYGKIVIDVQAEMNTPLIIELLSEKGILIAKEFIDTEKELVFDHLQTGKYQLRAIYDENDNKKWDTGSFIKKIHPEKVQYFYEIIDVRANWSISEIFVIK